MEFIIFVLMIIFLVLWLGKKPVAKSDDAINYQSKTYAQGYWDGYRAHQNGVSAVATSEETIVDHQQGVAVTQAVDVVEQPTFNSREQKEKHDLQNINTALYIASFLLVASAALFIGASLPESVRFIGVWIITILFYVVGLILYKTVAKLRPAAVAFTGTGLALLPFTGLAMYDFMLHDASLCWFITSVIGLVAFIIAAIYLKSQVIAYFAIAFSVSMATSSVATLNIELIWYYVVLIIFGSLLTFLATIKPKWVSECFNKPIQQTNEWIVPLALVASLFATTSLTVHEYWIITLVSMIYYFAVATSSLKGREVALFIARLLASITILLMIYDYLNLWTAVGLAMSVVGIVQIAVSIIFLPKHVAGDSNNEIWLWIGLIMQLFAPLFVLENVSWAIVITGQLSGLLLMSLGVSYYLRRAVVSTLGVVSLMILPILICTEVIKPALELHWASLIFIVFSVILIIIRFVASSIKLHSSWHWLLIISFCLFIVESLILTSGASAGWGLGVWLSVAVLLYCAVYLERQPRLVVVANIALLMSGLWLLDLLNITNEWMAIYISWIAFVVFYGMYWVMVALSKRQYGIYFWWSSVIVAGLFNLMSLNYSNVPVVTLAGLGLAVVSTIVIIAGWRRHQHVYIDVGIILMTIGLQRAISVNAPDINWLVYTHWWAVVIAGLSYLYYKAGEKMNAKFCIIVALSIVTLFSGMAALGAESGNVSDVPYRLIFLVEHILILISGLVLSKKLFAVWGAVGVILAVLWMLKGYTYILLASVAFVLIGIAIYALVRQSKNTSQ